MRFAGFLVEMEAVDEPVVFGGIQFLVWNLLSVQGSKLVHSNNVEVLDQLLVDFAAVHFQNSHITSSLLIQIQLFGDTSDQVSNDTILSDKNFQGFLIVLGPISQRLPG